MRAPERIRTDAYVDHVNPQWVKLLSLLDMNVSYERCLGAELYTTDGRRILDFLSGYCVHNAGHNHPRILAALKEELDKTGPGLTCGALSLTDGDYWRKGFGPLLPDTAIVPFGDLKFILRCSDRFWSCVFFEIAASLPRFAETLLWC